MVKSKIVNKMKVLKFGGTSVGSVKSILSLKEIVEKYEQLYGPIQGDIYDQVRYTDYLSKFSYVEYATSEELSDDFDWDLLQKLVL